MTTSRIETIDATSLAKRLDASQPDNESATEGFALVNVLDAKQFEAAHIPGSTNIPEGQEDRFEDRFARDKEIVVYCASPECPASEKAAEELARRGFEHVVEYEGGTSDWRETGHPIAGAEA